MSTKQRLDELDGRVDGIESDGALSALRQSTDDVIVRHKDRVREQMVKLVMSTIRGTIAAFPRDVQGGVVEEFLKPYRQMQQAEHEMHRGVRPCGRESGELMGRFLGIEDER